MEGKNEFVSWRCLAQILGVHIKQRRNEVKQ